MRVTTQIQKPKMMIRNRAATSRKWDVGYWDTGYWDSNTSSDDQVPLVKVIQTT